MRPVLGTPGISDERTFNYKFVFRDGKYDPLPGGGYIDVAKSRDPFNTPAIETLEPGLMIGQVTTTGLWCPTFFGKITGAITGTATSLTLSAAQATELVRRVGTTGTFKLMGPAAANGAARQLTVTYSAVNTTTGVVTITALGVNEVQTVNLSTAATAGNLRLLVQKTDGTLALTPNIAWSATDATLLSNANTALDTATGVSGGIVATAIPATDTDLGIVLTYSGTGYAGNTWALAVVDTMFTSNTGANVVRTTTGVPGAFVAGSLVSDTDGSQTPLSLIPHGYGVTVADGSTNTPSIEQLAAIPIAGIIDWTQVVPAVTDTGIKAWIKDKMTGSGMDNKFRFF